MEVYLECGTKRTFAGAVDWPGWCRGGRSEGEALEALLAYGSRYAAVLAATRLGFAAPPDLSRLVVVERLPGNAGTDFGVPGVVPAADREPCGAADLTRFEKILRAGWRAFDNGVRAARGKLLATGPRGGGRSLDAIVGHVAEADRSYLAGVGWKAPGVDTREAILAALSASAAGEIPPRGPRGGVRWPARYFVRRVAWHLLAHLWEIERRTLKLSS